MKKSGGNYVFRKWLLLLILLIAPALLQAQNLEIHHINVGQGTSVLIVGPDGTTLLFDGGRPGRGTSEVVPYLQSLGITTSLDYMVLSHRDSDHYSGLTETINAGYDVLTAVYDNGSDKTGTTITNFINATSTTTAGTVVPIPLGQVIALGSGATATCVVVNGNVIGSGSVSGALNNENDRSVGLLVQYGDFDFLLAGDLGGGADDNSCTGRSTGQVNVETPLVQAIMPGGANPLLTSSGVEVHHVNHHGSESSTNSDVMNMLTPAVACISVGASQGSNFHHPRIDVVENVLMSQASCITASSALVLQTEEGDPTGSSTSFAGYSVGDIVITTDGVTNYTVDASGAVTQGPDERSAAGLPLTLNFDGGSGGNNTVVMSEVFYDTPGTDSQEEWIELYNYGASTVDVSGWTITDNNGTGGTVTLPANSTIAPASFFTLAKNQTGFFALYGYDADSYASFPGLNNTGDALILTDNSAQEVDAVGWEGGASAGVPTGWGSSTAPNATTGNSIVRTDPNTDSNTFSDWSVAASNGNPQTQAQVNFPPVANANGPYSGVINQSMTFSSAGSNDPDGSITGYLWNFGDGNTSTAANPSHTYTSVGTFSVTLTVTDDGGLTDADNTTASISTPPSTTIVMSEIFYDTPGTDADEEWIEIYNLSGSGIDVSGWTITDNNGTGAVFVIPASTSIAAGTFLTIASDQAGFQALYGYDADIYGNIPGLNNTGDALILADTGGQSVDAVGWEGGASAGLPSGWGSTTNPNAPTGSSIVRTSPTVDTNTFSDWSVAANNGNPQTQPTNQAPVANANGPYSATAGQSVSFSSAGSNDPDGTISSYSWDFGDGNSSTQANPSHTYSTANTYTVTLTVTDNGGATGQDVTSATISSGSSWVTLTYDDFEDGWGNYTDGGGDCRRSANDATYAHQGTYCARIRDNSGAASSFYYTNGVDVTAYDQLKVEFWYYPRSMENGEDFWVQYFDGSTWQTVATFARGVDFENNAFYQVADNDIIIDRANYTFPDDMQIRIMCDASGNSDWIYVDEVRVSAMSSSAKRASAEEFFTARPATFTLEQNYPNPFNPSTLIRYTVKTEGFVSLVVYNTLGQRVKILVEGKQQPGLHNVNFDASGLASGIYYYRLRTA